MWLSIIIPVFNAEKYLDTCLSSILSQPVENFEVIAVDDGSTDDSWEILKKYKCQDSRVSTIRNPKNKLAGYSRNIGIQHSRGSYLWFIDADDWINPGAIELLYREVMNKEEADILSFGYCEHHIVDNSLESFIRVPGYRITEEKALVRFLQMKKGFTSMPFSYLFKKALFGANRLSFPVQCYFEDIFFMGQAFYYSSRVSLIPRILYNYNRMNPASITQLPSVRKILDLLNMYAKLQQFLQKKSEWDRYKYLFAFRFLMYGLPKCYRMYLSLPNKIRKDPSIKIPLQRMKKSKIMSLASLVRASELARRLTLGDKCPKSEFSRNIQFIICIKYALPLYEAVFTIKELKQRVKVKILSFPLKYFSLQSFDRMGD